MNDYGKSSTNVVGEEYGVSESRIEWVAHRVVRDLHHHLIKVVDQSAALFDVWHIYREDQIRGTADRRGPGVDGYLYDVDGTAVHSYEGAIYQLQVEILHKRYQSARTRVNMRDLH